MCVCVYMCVYVCVGFLHLLASHYALQIPCPERCLVHAEDAFEIFESDESMEPIPDDKALFISLLGLGDAQAKSKRLKDAHDTLSRALEFAEKHV